MYEDELICDMAEIYHIYDYRAMKARYIATLTLGLPPRSRVMSRLLAEHKKQMDPLYEVFSSPADFETARQLIAFGGR